MRLILTGATGLVGSGVLQAMLASKEITKVSILSRRAVPAVSNNPKIESVRPAGVDASDHDAIKPFIPDPGLAYRIMGVFLGPLFRTLMPSLHSPTKPLGEFLVGMAVGKYDQDLDAGGKGITTLPVDAFETMQQQIDICHEMRLTPVNIF
ncbi:hypothetical protein AUP68_04367 [Ilyonectria robusta]